MTLLADGVGVAISSLTVGVKAMNHGLLQRGQGHVEGTVRSALGRVGN